MRTLISLLLISIFSFDLSAQNCLPSGITFSSQSQVDNFATDYPGCTVIQGPVIIEKPVSNLLGLNQLTSIGGLILEVNHKNLVNFEGLENLTSINGCFEIEYNVALTSLTGLENLVSINGSLVIGKSEKLTDLSGLESLNSISIDLHIWRNDSLRNLSGLESLNSVGGRIFIDRNEVLTSMNGLESLSSVGGNVLIDRNDDLISINSLDNLTTIGGNLDIWRNNGLTNLNNLQNLTSVGGNLDIWKNDNLTTLDALENLTSVGGYCKISDNDGLTILNGLQNLNAIGEDLRITYNFALTDINAFENITSVNARLLLLSNSNLLNLQSLNNITSVGRDVLIESNSSLLTLDGLENLNSIGEDLSILNNRALLNLDGLENITSLKNNLTISENDSLTNLNGLENLNTIDGNLTITDNGALLSLSGLENITEIEGGLNISDNDSLNSLDDLENITTLGGDLTIADNGALTSLNGLENINSFNGDLTISNNDVLTSLIELENITSIEGRLYIHGNQTLTSLNGLENLNAVGGYLSISSNDALTSLNGLENLNAVGGYLSISRNDALTSLNGLENINAIGENLYIQWNDALTSLNGLENICTIEGNLSIYDNDALTSLNGLENINTIVGNLSIYDNDALTSLNGMENINTISGDLYIQRNDALAVCNIPFICEHLLLDGSNIIENNAPGCNSEDEILYACGNFGKVYHPIFYDLNQNGLYDQNEPFYADAHVIIDPGSIISYSNATNGGLKYLQLDSNFTISYNEFSAPNWDLTTDSLSYTVRLDTINRTDTLYFGIYPKNFNSDARSSIVSNNLRCNEHVTFEVIGENTGTTTSSGVLWFTVDPEILDIQFIDTPDTIIDTNTLGWFFDDLYPGNSIRKKISLQIPGPPDFPLGETITFSSWLRYEDINGPHVTRTHVYSDVVQCSYDPNDKLVNPLFPQNYALIEDELVYTVRFQNTGNAEAYDITILDTLDTQLDLSSFRFIASSHEEVLSVSRRNQFLSFDFVDIFLPDSTSNLELSQGYVMYAITPLESILDGTIINNSASIYFDFNPPIHTNTTENKMVHSFDADEDDFAIWEDCDDMDPSVYPGAPEIPNNDIDEDCDGDDFTTSTSEVSQPRPQIHPNPTNGFLSVEMPFTKPASLRVRDTSGKTRIVQKIEKIAQLDISELPSGLYLLIIKTEENQWVERIMKI